MSAVKLQDKLDEGYQAVARDPKRIRDEIDKLAGGPRPYQNASERWKRRGHFTADLYSNTCRTASKKDLYPDILRVMGEIGRPLLMPLIEELRVSDPTLRVELINVIGEIGYPQAALPAARTSFRRMPSTAWRVENRRGQRH